MATAVVVGVVVALVVGGATAALCVAQVRRVVEMDRGDEQRDAAVRASVERQLGAELHRMGDLVGQLHRAQAQSHGDLAARLGETVRCTRELGATTRQLQEALGNSRVRGQWGERMADDVLRAAGLVDGVSYARQRTLPSGARPDVSFVLPEGRWLHMDVKFPVDHYLASLEAGSPREQAEHEREFLRAVRGHLKALAGRCYAEPASTPGFALAFIPNEAIYAFLMAGDPGLVDAAMAQRLVLCSPFTLFAVLAVVRQSTEAFRLGQASHEILDCLARFRDEWNKFSDQLDRVGKQWETAHRGFEELTGTRRRQLERRLDHVDALRNQRLSVVAEPGTGQGHEAAPAAGGGSETPVREVGAGR